MLLVVCLYYCSAAPVWHSEGTKNVEALPSGIDHGVTQNPFERRWSPYDFNGG